MMIEANGTLYRVEYTLGDQDGILIAVNCVLCVLLLLMCGLFAYLWKNIIRPFGRLNDVPQELARGNLAVPISEEKSRFFGKFTWGVNLLREKIEDDRQKELSMQRDKKLLLLSLSHDIKTPLSAIKLNAKALAKGIYSDEEKRQSAAESINARADEIEHFVSEITKAASEDFIAGIGQQPCSACCGKKAMTAAPETNLAFRRKSCYNTGVEAARKADRFPGGCHAVRFRPHFVRERSFSNENQTEMQARSGCARTDVFNERLAYLRVRSRGAVR